MTCPVCDGQMRPEMSGLFDDRYGHPGEFDVVRCDRCGFMSTEPRLTDADLPALYARYYPRRRATPEGVRQSATSSGIQTSRGRWRARWITGQWAAHYEVLPGMRVLDYGCGDCASLLEIQALGADPVGIEVDPTVRDLASALGVKVHVGAIEQIPEPNGSFDAVTLSQVIEHVTDPERLLRQVYAKLKPDGLLVLTTPNSRSLTRRLLGRKWLHWHMPFHQNHFNSGSLRRLLARVGFDVERSGTFTPVPWWEYQLEMLLAPPRRGQPHAYFERGASAIRSSRVGRALYRPGRTLATAAARVLDVAGRGESLLVIARKRAA